MNKLLGRGTPQRLDPNAMTQINEFAVPYKVKAADYHVKRMRQLLNLGLLVGEGLQALSEPERAVANERHNKFF